MLAAYAAGVNAYQAEARGRPPDLPLTSAIGSSRRMDSVTDGEHDAVAEAVVALAVLLDEETRLEQPRAPLGVRPHGREQMVPPRRRVSHPKAGGDLTGQPSAFEVVHRTGRLGVRAELFAEVLGRLAEHAIERREIGRSWAGLALLGQFEARLAGEVLDGVEKAEALVLHEEADGAAVRPAAEAMVELLLAADREGGGLLVVERAAGLVVLSGLAQGDATVDEVDDVGAGEEGVDEVGGNSAGHGVSEQKREARRAWGFSLRGDP